jgi:death-on-curing protein
VKNHPFLDGNKRVGLAATIAFLGLNDRWIEADPTTVAELVVAVPEGRTGKAEVAVFVKEHLAEW